MKVVGLKESTLSLGILGKPLDPKQLVLLKNSSCPGLSHRIPLFRLLIEKGIFTKEGF